MVALFAIWSTVASAGSVVFVGVSLSASCLVESVIPLSSKFFTNADQNTLLKKFEGVFHNNPDIKYFDALVGYFRASGYFRIRQYLNDVPKIRILVGIDVDKITKNVVDFKIDVYRKIELELIRALSN